MAASHCACSVIIRAVTFLSSRHFGRESPAVSLKRCPVCGQLTTWDISVNSCRPVITDHLRDTKTQFSPSYLNKQPVFFFQALNFLVESFGLLNDPFPLPSILDAGYPVFDLHLEDILCDVILPSVLRSSL